MRRGLTLFFLIIAQTLFAHSDLENLFTRFVVQGSTAVIIGAQDSDEVNGVSDLVRDSGKLFVFESDPFHYKNLSDKTSSKKNIALILGDATGNDGSEPLDFYNLKNVSVIKIDASGDELAILDGATETLVRERPVLLIQILSNEIVDPKNITSEEVRKELREIVSHIRSLKYSVFREGTTYYCIPKKL